MLLLLSLLSYFRFVFFMAVFTTKYNNGGGMHLDDVASRITCLVVIKQ